MATLTLTQEQSQQLIALGSQPVLVEDGKSRFYLISEAEFAEYRAHKEAAAEDRLQSAGVHRASLEALRRWGQENPY